MHSDILIAIHVATRYFSLVFTILWNLEMSYAFQNFLLTSNNYYSESACLVLQAKNKIYFLTTGCVSQSIRISHLKHDSIV